MQVKATAIHLFRFYQRLSQERKGEYDLSFKAFIENSNILIRRQFYYASLDKKLRNSDNCSVIIRITMFFRVLNAILEFSNSKISKLDKIIVAFIAKGEVSKLHKTLATFAFMSIIQETLEFNKSCNFKFMQNVCFCCFLLHI